MKLGVFAGALAAVTLLALLGAESARFSLWTTSDEPAHLAAAREWRYGPGMVSNYEHPVLMKVLAGLTLPREKPAMEIEETRAGRAVMPFLFAGLALVTGLLTRALAGDAAGLAAAALVAVEPTFRGHGSLVQSDILVTFFFVAAALALEHAARSGSRKTLLASGVLYGFAMASKYSAFPFLAVFAVVAMVRLASGSFSSIVNERGEGRSKRADDSTRANGRPSVLHLLRDSFRALPSMLAFLVGPALVTLFLIQFLTFVGTSDAAFRAGIAHEFAGLPQERAAVALARTFPKSIAAYGAGLLFVQGVAGPGERFNYFFGEISGKGRAFYFPVALSIKLTTATVLFVLAVFVAAGVLAARGAGVRRLLAERALLPAALGGAYLLAACASNVNIGVRHALPVVPFAIAAAAGTLCTLVPRRQTLALALAAVVLAATCEAALRLGHEISFGNLLSGGPAGVPAILSDSNVDWGQEEGKIFERVRRGDLGRVGLASLMVDESGARAVGIEGQVTAPDAPVDTVFFSRFLWDNAAAIEKNTENWSKFVWLRGWLPPLRHGLEARALSIEPFGDTQLLLRLRPETPTRIRPRDSRNELSGVPRSSTRHALPNASAKFRLNGEGDIKGRRETASAAGAGMLCAFRHSVIERLNYLLRVELAAVAGYQTALRAVKEKAVGDSDHMLRLAAEHQRTVTALQGSVQARGGEPLVTADPWEGSRAAALTANGVPVRLESKEFVGALLEAEQRGLAEYEAALASLDDDARELVELELIPRQRRHVASLSAMLAHLAA